VANVLIACEFSGVLRDLFADLGHYVRSYDFLPGLGEHISLHVQGDVLPQLRDPFWDFILAFPPCTFLCNSGVRWLHGDSFRIRQMYKACDFFNAILASPAKYIVVENPVQHRYARNRIRKYDQIIHPWQHGHGETKQTCLWLKNLPLLLPSKIVKGRVPRIHYMPPSADRSMLRSATLPGVGSAMVSQWGRLCV